MLIVTTLGLRLRAVAISTSGIFLMYLLKLWFNLYVYVVYQIYVYPHNQILISTVWHTDSHTIRIHTNCDS